MTNTILFVVLALPAVLGVSSTIQDASLVTTPSSSSEITTMEDTALHRDASLPVLSRKRRYVVFPPGSSFHSGPCETMRLYVPLRSKFKIGLKLGFAWMLPYEAHELYLQKRDVDATAEAIAAAGFGTKHRADLYTVLEGVFSVVGLKGRECILRAVCEATEIKQNESRSDSSELLQGTFMEELVKLLFALPLHPKHRTPYSKARKIAGKCGENYSGCSSILDLKI